MSNVTDSQCHRTQPPSLGTIFQDFSAPFSSFDFVDRNFAASLAIRRCFSLARSNQDCKTLTVEKIGEMGLLLDENDDLLNPENWSFTAPLGGSICSGTAIFIFTAPCRAVLRS